MGADSEEKPQQVVCYKTGHEIGGVGFVGEEGSEDLKLAYLLSWPTSFSGKVSWRVYRESLLDLKTEIKR